MEYKVVIYEDENGKSPIAEMLNDLNVKARSSKEHRVRLKKISEYVELLKAFGTRAGLTSPRHLESDIWELRQLTIEYCLHIGKITSLFFCIIL